MGEKIAHRRLFVFTHLAITLFSTFIRDNVAVCGERFEDASYTVSTNFSVCTHFTLVSSYKYELFGG